VIEVAAVTLQRPVIGTDVFQGVAIEGIYPGGFFCLNLVAEPGCFTVFGNSHAGNPAVGIYADQ
jgi:hypothetical protein